MMVEWARAEALLLLVPLGILAAYLWNAHAAALPLPRARELSSGARSDVLMSRSPLMLRLTAPALLVIAIAGPRSAGATIEQLTLGVPIVVALDISSSMLARDLGEQDRMTVAKQSTIRFIRERERDPIGVVAFAGESLTLVPITMHRRVLENAVDQLTIGLLEDGTAIGEGLATAIARLRRVDAESRVVILMSDGENNRGQIEPLEAAQAAATLNIQVYTIGVGSERPASASPAPGLSLVEEPGGLDETLLREIAAVTSARYFRADDAGALDRIYSEIDDLVTSPIETRRHVEFVEWHLPLLLAAAGLLLLEWGIRSSRWGVIP
ncbi:VWA domain-containing protein [soil metagenome]